MCNTLNSLLFADRQNLIDKLIISRAHSGLYVEDEIKNIIGEFIKAAEEQDSFMCEHYLKEFEKKYKNS